MGKRNPNGYGSVTKLKGNRTKPWIAKITIYDQDGRAKQSPIGYAETEEKANILLAQYNNNPWEIDREKVTLAVLYQRWAKIKMPKLSAANQTSLKAAYKHCSKYYGKKYRSIKSYHMQDCIDSCGRGVSTQTNIRNLFSHLDKFAFEIDLIDKMYSQITTVPPAPETRKSPFAKEEIISLWEIQDKPWVDTVLIYLYTGFRLNELLGMKCDQVSLEENYLLGGSKSENGKNRIVPIHPRIRSLIERRMGQGSPYLITLEGKKLTKAKYYPLWNEAMKAIGASHTPHEARHTFRSLLDSAGGNKKCIDMLMGHKSADVGLRTYTHKTMEELRDTIALLK